MSEENAKQAVKVLSQKFKRTFIPEAIKAVWPELVKQPDAAIDAAVDWFVLNRSYLPDPPTLLQRVKDEARKISTEESRKREREWAEKKGGETPEQVRRQGSIFSKEQSDQHGRHAVKAILLMLSPASRQDKLECFRVMDAQYPGADWALIGAKAQKEWDRMDKRPHYRDVSEASPQFQANYRRERERKGLD